MTVLILIILLALILKVSGIKITFGRRKMTRSQKTLFWTMFVLAGPFALMYLLEVKAGTGKPAYKKKRRRRF